MSGLAEMFKGWFTPKTDVVRTYDPVKNTWTEKNVTQSFFDTDGMKGVQAGISLLNTGYDVWAKNKALHQADEQLALQRDKLNYDKGLAYAQNQNLLADKRNRQLAAQARGLTIGNAVKYVDMPKP